MRSACAAARTSARIHSAALRRSSSAGRRRSAAARLADPRELSARVAGLEPDGAGLPVLVRRYLELGGEFAGWHVDCAFGDSLDGLMVLSLDRADPVRVARYSRSRSIAPRTSSVVS